MNYMKKRNFMFLALFLLFILLGCQQVNVPDFRETNYGFPCYIKEEDYILTKEQVLGFAEQEWGAAANFGDFQGERLKACIENQETATCFLLYTMYNNRPDLCQYVPEKVDVEFFTPPSAATGQGGGYETKSCYYRDTCNDYVKLYNQ